MTNTSNKVYIGTINKIDGFNRISFSMTLNDIITEIDTTSINNDLQNGIITKFIDIEDADPIVLNIINTWFNYINNKGYYNDWMKDYTSISLYLLYQGSEVI